MTLPASIIESAHGTRDAGPRVETLTQHVIEIISDSGEGAQRCGQALGAIAARMGNGIWTVEIIPAEIRPPARSVAGASGNRIRIAAGRVGNGGDETDLVVAFNEQVLLGRVRSGELKRGATHPARKRCGATIPIPRWPRPTWTLAIGSGRPATGCTNPDGTGVPEDRGRRASRQEHVRARAALQLVQPRSADRARTGCRHIRQESRIDHSIERRVARGRLRVGSGQPRLQVPDPRAALDGAADRRERQHGAGPRHHRVGDGHLCDVPNNAGHARPPITSAKRSTRPAASFIRPRTRSPRVRLPSAHPMRASAPLRSHPVPAIR